MIRKLLIFLQYTGTLLLFVAITITGIVAFVKHEYKSLKWQDYTGEVYSVTVYHHRGRGISPTHCTAYFTYIVDDYEYEGVVYGSTEIYDEGDSIGLLYDPDKPWQYTTVTTASDIKSGFLILAGGLLTYFEVRRLLKRWEEFNDIEDAKRQIDNPQKSLDTE